jgi:ankyrin repeat protein
MASWVLPGQILYYCANLHTALLVFVALQCCQLLLQLGADASIKDADGHTALQLGPSSWHFGNEQQA